MKKIFGIAMFAGVLVFSGCQNTVNTVENSPRTMTPNVIQDKRFVTDSFLRDRLVLKEVITSKTNEGFLRVQVAALNNRTGFFSELWSDIMGGNPYYVSYKFTWFEKDGMTVGNEVWLTKIIKPGEIAYFDSVAPNKNCSNFVLNLKEVEN